MATMNMVNALNNALKLEMAKDKTVMCLGEDVGLNGGVFRVTDGLQKEFGADRVADTPLAELGIVGTSVGLAVNGMKPVAEIQFSGFLYPVLDQLFSHAARIRTRSRGDYHVPLVVRTPYGGGIHALELHCESPESMLSHVAGLKVVVPSDPYEAKGLLISAIRDPDPVVFLEPMRVYRAIKMDVPEEEYTIPLGKADVVQEGSEVTVIAWGAMLRVVKKALENSEHDIEIINPRTICPLDTETIVKSVQKTGRCVIVHEAMRNCGFGAEIIARINENCFYNLEAPVERVTGYDAPFPMAKLEGYFIPDEKRIVAAVEKVLAAE